jgi:hypothetical protein
MLTQPSSDCEVHAAYGYPELSSNPEPVGTSVNISVCVVNNHRIPHLQLLPCHFKAPISRLENVLINSFIPQRFKIFPVEGRLSSTWAATEHDDVLFILLGERSGRWDYRLLKIVLWLKLTNEWLGRLFKKVLFGSFETDTDIGRKVTAFWLVNEYIDPLRSKASISTIWSFMLLSSFECGELTDQSRHGPFVACPSLLVQQHHRHKRIASSQLILRARDCSLPTFPATCQCEASDICPTR